MGGKRGKYVYVKTSDGWYVKVRVLKNRDEGDAERYIVVGPKVKEAPLTYSVIEEGELPPEVQAKLKSL